MESHENLLSSNLSDIDPDSNLLVNGTCQYYSELIVDDELVKNSFSLLHANMRSCRSNQQELENYLKLGNIDFTAIALTETWLSDLDVSLYNIPNYSHLSYNRHDRQGGGVSLHIAESYNCIHCPDINNGTDTNLMESLFAQIE